MADSVPTRFAYSFLELKTTFQEPLFVPLWTPESPTARSLFLALRDWGASLENVGIRQQISNMNELQLNFNLPRFSTTVQLTVGTMAVFVNNPSWDQAGQIIQIATAALGAVRDSASIRLQNHQLSLAMHLMPSKRTPREITSQFLSIEQSTIASLGETRNFGFSIYGTESAWIVDASALYADALFVKIVRTFAAETTVPQMASVLEKEEKQLLQLLGLHEDA